MAMQCNDRLRGRTAIVLPAGCPHSLGLIAGNCRQKVQGPPVPQGWGVGTVVTND